MCRTKTEGGRRCASCTNPVAKRGYARAKYAADTAAGAAARDPEKAAQPEVVAAPASVWAAYGERAEEIAALAAVVPTIEDLEALKGESMTDLDAVAQARAWVALDDTSLGALPDEDLLGIVGTTTPDIMGWRTLRDEDLADAVHAVAGRARDILDGRGLSAGDVEARAGDAALPFGAGLRPTRIRQINAADRTPAQRTALAVAAIFDMSHPGPNGSTIRFETTTVDVTFGGDVRVHGRALMDDGTGETPVGSFYRTLSRPSGFSGQTMWGQTPGLLFLQEHARGGGAGTALQRRNENALIASGFGYMDIVAGNAVGGYAWAKTGYSWAPNPHGLPCGRDVHSRLKKIAKTDTPDGPVRAMLARVEDPTAQDYPTPAEIAGLDRGKEILVGTVWQGRRDLTRPV